MGLGNKKGSTSVFLVFILGAMLALVGAFIFAAKEVAVKSYGDGVLQLAGRSILSEFDLKLKDEYGVFAFYGEEHEVNKKVREYAEYSLHADSYGQVNAVTTGFSEYSLGNVNVFEKEVLDNMKFLLAKNLLKKEEGKAKEGKNRVLRNQAIINSLPSSAFEKSSTGFSEWVSRLADDLPSFDQVIDTGKDNVLINKYILMNFKNTVGSTIDRNTFFTNEVEYILEGEYDNEKNKQGVRSGIVVLRTALNVAYIYMDPEKRTATMAMAEVMTPGPAALVTQAVIISTWAIAEAENDAELLEGGKKVPLMKDDASWATDLDAVMNNTSKGYIEPKSNRGLDYEDYLMVFLYFESRELKLARTLDLIQINMKGTYNKNFLVRDYNCGMTVDGQINKKHYEYEYEMQY